ncbi:hypothetical protein SCHPADRAFT_889568 [Schizopora paradoxa]|uniref:Uncharacterized protein n=1 Tax=Schizopora paradoxa TaxID=27342 RepID=A0A0H2RQ53_9AGAM|nr:hypothetical protein SCHPADRAFT_889568 [Schizopora paradoxa]
MAALNARALAFDIPVNQYLLALLALGDHEGHSSRLHSTEVNGAVWLSNSSRSVRLQWNRTSSTFVFNLPNQFASPTAFGGLSRNGRLEYKVPKFRGNTGEKLVPARYAPRSNAASTHRGGRHKLEFPASRIMMEGAEKAPLRFYPCLCCPATKNWCLVLAARTNGFLKDKPEAEQRRLRYRGSIRQTQTPQVQKFREGRVQFEILRRGDKDARAIFFFGSLPEFVQCDGRRALRRNRLKQVLEYEGLTMDSPVSDVRVLYDNRPDLDPRILLLVWFQKSTREAVDGENKSISSIVQCLRGSCAEGNRNLAVSRLPRKQPLTLLHLAHRCQSSGR